LYGVGIVLDLGRLRKDWESLDSRETRLPQAITVQESLHRWIELQVAFEWQLQQTAALFERDRRAAMAELQARLRRLAG